MNLECNERMINVSRSCTPARQVNREVLQAQLGIIYIHASLKPLVVLVVVHAPVCMRRLDWKNQGPDGRIKSVQMAFLVTSL